MPNTREKLMKLLCHANSKATEAEAFEDATYAEQLGIQADHLIANGVTFATDNNVGDKWISVKDRLPKGAKSGETADNVIAYTIEGEVTTGWVDALGGDKWWLIIGTDDTHTCWGLGYVTHWMPLPQPPEGE